MRRAALAIALLTLAGCDRAPTTELDGSVVALEVADYRYDHQNVSVGPGNITFAVTNAGTEPTNFRLRREGRKRELASIATLDPDEYGTATVELKPGRYVMYSSVGRHEPLGEHGILTVTRR